MRQLQLHERADDLPGQSVSQMMLGPRLGQLVERPDGGDNTDP